MEAIVAGLWLAARTVVWFAWQSLFGLIFGFVLSAIAQTAFSRRDVHRFLGPGVRGLVNASGFGIVASACSYGAAAAARGFFARGADVRSVFAFMIASTNMNLAILVMFWALLGWQFAFAEFVGGIVIIAVVSIGLTLFFSQAERQALAHATLPGQRAAVIDECLQCGMEGEREHAVEFEGTTYLFCGSRHEREFRENPRGVLDAAESDDDRMEHGFAMLRHRSAWANIWETVQSDFVMLRGELLIGFTIAGIAAALVPQAWLGSALRALGSVPFAGYPLLLLGGLVLAMLTFVCSMGNVPVARYLANAGVPLGANTTFIYGDLLIPPLLAIYRKSFPPKVTWSFVGLFVAGALLAGALMDAVFRHARPEPMSAAAMSFSDTFTLVSNLVAIVALGAVVLAARAGAAVDAHAHGDENAPQHAKNPG